MRRSIEIGDRFGRLTVISHAGKRIKRDGTVTKDNVWLCECDCGNLQRTHTSKLNGGRVKSCGCFRRDNTTEMKTTHGCSKRLGYSRWLNIIKRCYNEDCVSYLDYGAKGVTVCDEWRNSPEKFCDWFDEQVRILKIEHCDLEKWSIDKDELSGVDKIYSPDTCQLITTSENSLLSNKDKMGYFEVWYLDDYVGVFYNQREFSRNYGLTHQRVQECISGKREQYEGYTFKKVM